jgi:hypothetical protein
MGCSTSDPWTGFRHDLTPAGGPYPRIEDLWRHQDVASETRGTPRSLCARRIMVLLSPQGCILMDLRLTEGRCPTLRAAYQEHRHPQSPQRQRPIGHIEPRGGSRGRADKAQKGESGATEGDANDRTPPEGARGQDHYGHMRNADDDPQRQGDIEEKHAEGQPKTQGKHWSPPCGTGLCDASLPRPREGVRAHHTVVRRPVSGAVECIVSAVRGRPCGLLITPWASGRPRFGASARPRRPMAPPALDGAGQDQPVERATEPLSGPPARCRDPYRTRASACASAMWRHGFRFLSC